MIVLTANYNFGPFDHVTTDGETMAGLRCTRAGQADTLLPFSAIGEYTISDDDLLATVPPAPPEPVPEAVTMRQARLALLGAGLLDSVNTAIAAMTGTAGAAARIEWEYSKEVQRNKELVQALGPALGLSDAQLDALFITASKIE